MSVCVCIDVTDITLRAVVGTVSVLASSVVVLCIIVVTFDFEVVAIVFVFVFVFPIVVPVKGWAFANMFVDDWVC